MERPQQRTSATRRRIIAGVVAGLIVFTLLFPWGGGQDLSDATCFSMFGWYTVPCGGGVAIAAGVATGALVWLVLWLIDRRRN